MIELTAQDGSTLLVNPAVVWQVRRGSGDQTAIYAASGATLFVRERYEEVAERFLRWAAARDRSVDAGAAS